MKVPYKSGKRDHINTKEFFMGRQWWKEKDSLGKMERSMQAKKKSGGLDIKDIHFFNLSLLGKWFWRITKEEEGLWFRGDEV